MQQISLLHCKLKFIHARKLWPAETECAICVTSLSLTGKKQYSLSVFMLHTVQLYSVNHWNILFLTCRIRIQFHPYIINLLFKSCLISFVQKRSEERRVGKEC